MPKDTAPASKSTKSAPSLLTPSREEIIVLPWSEVKPVYDQMVAKAARRLKMPGFRQGKVPVKVALPYLKPTELVESTVNELLPAAYQKLMTDKKIRPLTHPEVTPVKVEFDQDWEIKFEIAEIPEIDVTGYEKIVQVAKLAAASHTPDHGHEQHDHNDGADKADQKAGKEPKKLDAAAEREHILKHVFNDLVAKYQPGVPELLVKRETGHELQHLARSLNQLGISLEQYLQRRQMKAEDLTSEVAATSIARLQLELLLETIGVDQKLTATDAEIEKQLATIADDQLRAEKSKDPEYRQYVRSIVTRQKTLDHLLSL